MTFTKRFSNYLSIILLYAMEILHPVNISFKPERTITTKEYKLLK